MPVDIFIIIGAIGSFGCFILGIIEFISRR